ncbi:4-hydroxythreonine-4-phosphate dehydrogenase PdxA [Pajaroellobacter abortibovis]|uniref:4-hydroxythreonine-4-phosphate dehydrogenase PdxA n=1 Tax=Pajaroellobacter abortibovis TaxID=1882918 RepID=A0A1L6MWN8_9BACT|nr:4-hydroxythreonine-4-phosphate dehydrogenase PdxA [Pajaroellobacter abortibovis]APR99874.1 4-hydroxythreonine-4-phosphate dehydrogenase PdxA [Pajaroellobacter abortibovis]
MDRARLAISIGCPCGIGPEVSLLAAFKRPFPSLLVGDEFVLRRTASLYPIDSARLIRVQSPEEAWALQEGTHAVFQPTSSLEWNECEPGVPSSAAGAAQLTWIDTACDLVAQGVADALVTGPVSKYWIASSQKRGDLFRGHTEYLKQRLGALDVVMAFWTERLVTALVTTHLPLIDVPRAVTSEQVERTIYYLGLFLACLHEDRTMGRIAVSGLNPHAGEDGLLGHGEEQRIREGIHAACIRLEEAQIRGEVIGPIPSEVAFRLAVQGDYSGVVAMYHDQATIPLKLVNFGEAVNVSLGLPIIRTSVDHGTAYDRAGKGSADPRGMVLAMHLAEQLV